MVSLALPLPVVAAAGTGGPTDRHRRCRCRAGTGHIGHGQRGLRAPRTPSEPGRTRRRSLGLPAGRAAGGAAAGGRFQTARSGGYVWGQSEREEMNLTERDAGGGTPSLPERALGPPAPGPTDCLPNPPQQRKKKGVKRSGMGRAVVDSPHRGGAFYIGRRMRSAAWGRWLSSAAAGIVSGVRRGGGVAAASSVRAPNSAGMPATAVVLRFYVVLRP